MKNKKKQKHRQRKSSMPYKVSTMKIGGLIQVQARVGNPKAQENAKKFMEYFEGEFDE